MEIKIDSYYVLSKRTPYSKTRVLNKNGEVTTSDVANRIIYDYETQSAEPEYFFKIKDDEINGYTENLDSPYVFIPEGIKHIAPYAFQSLRANFIYVPNSVSFIGLEAFKDCSYLRNIVLPDKLEEISEGLLCRCGSLRDILLPSNLKDISTYAFSGCGQLENIILPDSVELIDSRAFAWCGKLKSINVPKNLTIFGNSPFANSGIQTLIFKHDLSNSKNPHANYGDFTKGSIIRRIEIDKSVSFIDPNLFASVHIFEVDYNGTKEEFEKFKSENKELSKVLDCCKINIRENIDNIVIPNKRINSPSPNLER